MKKLKFLVIASTQNVKLFLKREENTFLLNGLTFLLLQLLGNSESVTEMQTVITGVRRFNH